MSPVLLRRLALSALVALMVVSAAFASIRVNALSPGYVLAALKIVSLAFLFKRVRDRDAYTMQWSSMFILLFLAEGTVRATSDPQPSATLGALEAVLATGYFAAVLGLLRPLKKAARLAKRDAR